MRGEIPFRCDTNNSITRNISLKDGLIPGTPVCPNVRTTPNYQRMLSNESRHSDKDSVSEKE